MPWHADAHPTVDYKGRSVRVDGQDLPVEMLDSFRTSTVSALGVKKFRSLLRKKKNRKEFMVFGLVDPVRLNYCV